MSGVAPDPLPDYMRVWRSPSVGWAWGCRKCPYDTRSAHLTEAYAEKAAADHVAVFHSDGAKVSGIAPDPPEYEYKDDSARGRWGVAPDPLDISWAGKRVLRYDNGRQETWYALFIDHSNGPWDAIYCKTEEQARHVLALAEVARAARACVTLEYDPDRNQEINEELGRRADVLRAALARLDKETAA